MTKPIYNEAAGTIKSDTLYFMTTAEGHAKIGRSANPTARLKNIQIGSPIPVKLEFSFPNMGWQEKVWHTAFHHNHLHGEWYKDTFTFREAIHHLRKKRDWLLYQKCPRHFDESYQRNFVKVKKLPPDLSKSEIWRSHLNDYRDKVLFNIEPFGPKEWTP